MRVAVNILPIMEGKTGIGYYAQDLFKASLFCQSADFLYITSSHNIPAPLSKGYPKIEELKVNSPSMLWEQLNMQDELKRKGINAYHSPIFTCPVVKEIPSIITIHDVIPESNPEFCSEKFLAFYHQHIGPSVRACEMIITTSEFSKKEIMKYFKVPEEKILVVYQAVSEKFSPNNREKSGALRQKYNLPKNFILYVGMLDQRKNIERLIKAFSVVSKKIVDLHLVLVGRTDSPEFDIESMVNNSRCPDRIKLLGYQPDDDLVALYATASLFVFPSLFEGFGRPVLEAMASGTPVVCSNNSSLPEIAEDAVEYFDPLNIEGIAEAIVKVSCDNSMRKKMVQSGLKRSKDFSYQSFAEQLDSFYRKMKERL